MSKPGHGIAVADHSLEILECLGQERRAFAPPAVPRVEFAQGYAIRCLVIFELRGDIR
jgi:hypothetical protein